jgi:hypothetical protein
VCVSEKGEREVSGDGREGRERNPDKFAISKTHEKGGVS